MTCQSNVAVIIYLIQSNKNTWIKIEKGKKRKETKEIAVNGQKRNITKYRCVFTNTQRNVKGPMLRSESKPKINIINTKH
jgi:hypothetical protein